MDGSPPGSPVPGILQARTLEWVAISFSNAWKWKVKVKSLSHVWVFATPWTAAYQAPLSMGVSRQEYWSGVPLPSPSSRLACLINVKTAKISEVAFWSRVNIINFKKTILKNTSLYIHLCLQQIASKCLLWARHCPRYWEYKVDKIYKSTFFTKLHCKESSLAINEVKFIKCQMR